MQRPFIMSLVAGVVYGLTQLALRFYRGEGIAYLELIIGTLVFFAAFFIVQVIILQFTSTESQDEAPVSDISEPPQV